jgi:hypothetical protein
VRRVTARDLVAEPEALQGQEDEAQTAAAVVADARAHVVAATAENQKKYQENEDQEACCTYPFVRPRRRR